MKALKVLRSRHSSSGGLPHQPGLLANLFAEGLEGERKRGGEVPASNDPRIRRQPNNPFVWLQPNIREDPFDPFDPCSLATPTGVRNDGAFHKNPHKSA